MRVIRLPFDVAYNECDYYADQLVEYLEGNVNFMLTFFKDKVSKIKVIKPDATYLLWLDCRELGMTQDELIKIFLEKANIALNQGAMLEKAGTGFMRINISCRRAVLEDALKHIEKAVNSLK